MDARSDLFALGLVLLEMSTGKNLLDADLGVPEETKASLSSKQRARVKRAIRRARLAGCAPTIEETIWRAATYTQEDVEAVTAKLPQSLRLPLCKLLQRSPAARYQTGEELATELRLWLAGSFDKGDAAAELKDLKRVAGEVLVEMGMKRPRRYGRSQDDITTS